MKTYPEPPTYRFDHGDGTLILPIIALNYHLGERYAAQWGLRMWEDGVTQWGDEYREVVEDYTPHGGCEEDE